MDKIRSVTETRADPRNSDGTPASCPSCGGRGGFTVLAVTHRHSRALRHAHCGAEFPGGLPRPRTAA